MIDLNLVIAKFAAEYQWHLESQNPKPVSIGDGINSGLCDLFAERVKTLYPQAKVLYDEEIDHTYLKINGKFFDAENPLGVEEKEKMVWGGKPLIVESKDGEKKQ
jgi:hypothetical protein